MQESKEAAMALQQASREKLLKAQVKLKALAENSAVGKKEDEENTDVDKAFLRKASRAKLKAVSAFAVAKEKKRHEKGKADRDASRTNLLVPALSLSPELEKTCFEILNKV
jgi:hypothetical protein